MTIYRLLIDHGKLNFGIAKDQNGNKYYKFKNSWEPMPI